MKLFILIIAAVTVMNVNAASNNVESIDDAISYATAFDNSLADTVGEGDIDLGDMIGFSVNNSMVTLHVTYVDGDTAENRVMVATRNLITEEEMFSDLKTGEQL